MKGIIMAKSMGKKGTICGPNRHLLKLNYKHFNLDDATLFVKKVGRRVVYLVVYVDDLFITGNNDDYITSIKKELQKVFDMTNLELLHYYLGIEVDKKPKHIFISQRNILENY
jgi:hypothetical protein